MSINNRHYDTNYNAFTHNFLLNDLLKMRIHKMINTSDNNYN